VLVRPPRLLHHTCRMDIQVVEAIPTRCAAQVGALLAQCFRPADWTPTRRQEHGDRFCSDGDAWRHVLALVDDRRVVAGVATVFRRTIVWQRTVIALGGLGSVCTAPAWRRQGVATAVARAALAELERGGAEVAYLCAAVHDPGIVALYGRAGFVPLGRPHTYYGRSGRLYEDHDGMIAPVGSSPVFEAIRQAAEPWHIGTGNW
jgi:ribosomal protein S18 acetylase RimI-like enzyme